MAGPALGPTGNTSGLSAANPAQGQLGLLGMLANSITPEAMEQAQLKRSETEAAIYQAAEAKRQALLNAIQNDPTLAGSKGMLRQTQQAYQGTGIAPPITKGPGGPQVSASGLGGESFPAWFQKNQAEIMASPQGSRGQIAQAAGIPMTPQQAQIIEQLPYVPNAASTRANETAQETFEKNTVTLLKQGLGTASSGPNLATIRAAVQQWQQEAPRFNLDPHQFDAYLQSAVGQLSPMQQERLRVMASTVGKNDAMTQEIVKLLPEKVNYFQAHIDEMKATTNSLNKLVGPKAAQLAAMYARDMAGADMAASEADFYQERIQQAQNGGNIDGSDLGPAVQALKGGMDAMAGLIKDAEATKRSIMGSVGYAVAGQAQTQMNAELGKIDTQEKVYKAKLNGYQEQLNSLTGAVQPTQAQPPSAQPPGTKPPNQKPPAQSDPPTQMHNGKMYYLHPNGKYYTAPPQAGQ
jgi:hypothetical protein